MRHHHSDKTSKPQQQNFPYSPQFRFQGCANTLCVPLLIVQPSALRRKTPPAVPIEEPHPCSTPPTQYQEMTTPTRDYLLAVKSLSNILQQVTQSLIMLQGELHFCQRIIRPCLESSITHLNSKIKSAVRQPWRSRAKKRDLSSIQSCNTNLSSTPQGMQVTSA